MSVSPARILVADQESGSDSDDQVGVQQERRFVSKKMISMVALGSLLVMGAAVAALSTPNSTVHEASSAFVQLQAEKPPPVLSSEEEGHKLGRAWIESFSKSIGAGDFKDHMELFAPKFEYTGSGNIPPSDTYTKEKFWDGSTSAFGGSWGALVSSFEPLNIMTVVDTQNGVVYVGFEVVMLVDGHGKVPPSPTSIFRLPGSNFALSYNSAKKVTKWAGTWDPIDPNMGAAVVALMPHPPPAPPPAIITTAEGKALANKLLKETSRMFAAGKVPKQDLYADEMTWDMSGPSGSGPKADFYKVLTGSWMKLASAMIPTVSSISVDPLAGRILIVFHVTLILDGHGAVPAHEGIWSGKNYFELIVNKDHKITDFTARWDENSPSLGAKIGAIMAATKK